MSEYIKGGYYIKAKRTQRSEISKCTPCTRETWDWLLMNAEYERLNIHGNTVNRGELLVKRSEIIEALSWQSGRVMRRYTKAQMDTAMNTLVNLGMVKVLIKGYYNLITVCNYTRYQNPDNYKITSGSANESTNGYVNESGNGSGNGSGNASTSPTYNKKKKEEIEHTDGKKTGSRIEISQSIITEYTLQWNSIASKYNLKQLNGKMSDFTKTNLASRIESGFTVDKFMNIDKSIAGSELLRGEKSDSSWKIDFDWLVKDQDKFDKVVDGGYVSFDDQPKFKQRYNSRGLPMFDFDENNKPFQLSYNDDGNLVKTHRCQYTDEEYDNLVKEMSEFEESIAEKNNDGISLLDAIRNTGISNNQRDTTTD